MAILPNANITITKPLLTCPACEKDIDAETVISFDGGNDLMAGVSAKTVNLNGRVVGIKLQHDCTPKTTRGRGRPPGAKNKPKPEVIAMHQSEERSKAEEHRDRLRAHEQAEDEGPGGQP